MKKPAGRRDTRRFDRRWAALSITVRAAESKVDGALHLNSADLSEGGAFLRSDLLFEVGENLDLEIPLPSGVLIKAAGRVARVWRKPSRENPAGMGIEFTNLKLDDRRAIISSFIKTGAKKTGSP